MRKAATRHQNETIDRLVHPVHIVSQRIEKSDISVNLHKRKFLDVLVIYTILYVPLIYKILDVPLIYIILGVTLFYMYEDKDIRVTSNICTHIIYACVFI
jgi:hypothetical protein